MEKMQTEHECCKEEMRNIIEEARVILPGVQALFGFQTIAVFNDRFADMPSYATLCHLIGLSMVVIAIALVMTPAIYYRAIGPDSVSRSMVRRSALMLRGAMAPLATGLALDMFTVIYRSTEHLHASIGGALATFVILTGLWFAFPWFEKRRLKPASGLSRG